MRRAALVGLAAFVVGCSRGDQVPAPPAHVSAAEVAHIFMRAYQAGDADRMKQLEAPWLQAQPLTPGSLGRVTNVRWLKPLELPAATVGPHWARGEIDVSFNADTSGSPDGTIPAGKGWAWGFVLARRTPTSPWIVVDDGTG